MYSVQWLVRADQPLRYMLTRTAPAEECNEAQHDQAEGWRGMEERFGFSVFVR